MFKKLFNRNSPLVRLLEILGLVNSFFFLRGSEVGPVFWLTLFLLSTYLLILLCDAIGWYSKEECAKWGKNIGIRVHFLKARVPSSYLLAITSTVCLLGIEPLSLAVLIVADLCMLIVVPVNGILIWFHFKDKEKLPINYFSLHRHASPAAPLDTRRSPSEAGLARSLSDVANSEAVEATSSERSRRSSGEACL